MSVGNARRTVSRGPQKKENSWDPPSRLESIQSLEAKLQLGRTSGLDIFLSLYAETSMEALPLRLPTTGVTVRIHVVLYAQAEAVLVVSVALNLPTYLLKPPHDSHYVFSPL